ncbi:MAG TPA: FAD-dependent oxidoreductase [Steroidobacteraceae bacterium]|nr:FAD-dependent oxidoreductase [Steroidobacteraceae bacterium]
MTTSTESRYQALFEPLRLGPVIAPNRFYQVPHCSGMGHVLPQTLAAMRGMKAEGGWGVVCTEYCSIHPSSDDQPYPFAALWDEDDVANLAAMTQQVHAHGALAGVELWHGGSYVPNLATRVPSLGVRSLPSREEPVQSQRMDRADIRAFREWHRAAARRARQAGFDIVYVYPTHGYLMWEFLSRSLNQRSDEYGGSLENRARLLRELLEDTRAAVGDRCAIAVRFSADGHGDEHLSAAEAHDLIGMLDHLPDLWDLVVSDYYGEEMATSRFVPEGSLEERVARVRRLTRKPLVSVGRFTSPDTMVRQLRAGVLDLIGAARPSIADPFLPRKIREGRLDEIRECIGCNVCYASNYRGTALRCTQNPTMGEEWRRGWHPERVPPGKAGTVLVVGAGPAGLEAAHILGKRGYTVTLADAAAEPGGRVTLESRLPGLAEWARVRDYRLTQLRAMPQVSMYLGNRLSAGEVREFGAGHVLIATGARWRRDGVGRWHTRPLAALHGAVLTPDDIMQGARPAGAVTIFDDDHYYMAAVIAVLLARAGAQVTYVTPTGRASEWSHYTGEQRDVQSQLLELGVDIRVSTVVAGFDGAAVTLGCVYSGRQWQQSCAALVLVTSREPEEQLFRELVGEEPSAASNIQRIGDCRQPALIAHAVYSGHKAARELDRPAESLAVSRDRTVVSSRGRNRTR